MLILVRGTVPPKGYEGKDNVCHVHCNFKPIVTRVGLP